MTPRWRAGLTHIWCVECGRDLDWALPIFVERHPMHRCTPCRQQQARKAVYATNGGRPDDSPGASLATRPALLRTQRRRWWR